MNRRALAVLLCVSLGAGIQCSRATSDLAPQSLGGPATTSGDATTSATVKTLLVVSLSFAGHHGDLETIRIR